MRLAKLIKTAFISGITLAILSGCGGGGGNPLSWLFDKDWQGVERVDNVDSHGTYVGYQNNNYLAVNNNGDIALVWTQNDSNNHPKVWLSKYDGDDWSTPDSSMKPNNYTAITPSVSITDNNKIVAVWEEFHSGFFIPKSNVYNGSSWHSSIFNINDGTNSTSGNVVLATNNNYTIAVWSQKLSSHYKIIARVYNHNTGNWSTAHVLSSNIQNSYNPVVAIHSNNRVVIGWREYDGSHYHLKARIYNINSLTPVGSVHQVDQLNTNVSNPAIASDKNGNTIIVWKQSDSSWHINIYAAKLSGTIWSYLGEIDNSDKVTKEPIIKYNKANSEFVVMWAQQNSDNKYVIHLNRYSSGSWQGVEVLEDATDATESKEPKIAFDSDGNAVAIWLKKNSSNKFDVVAKSYDGSEWGDSVVIDNLDESAYDAAIAFDGDDDAVVVWRQKDSSGQYHIFTNTLE